MPALAFPAGIFVPFRAEKNPYFSKLGVAWLVGWTSSAAGIMVASRHEDGGHALAPVTHHPLTNGCGQARAGGTRVPGSHSCKAPSGSSPGALAQPCRCFSCPLEELPILPPSASDADGFASRRAILPPACTKESPFVWLSKQGPRRWLTPPPCPNLHHPKTQSPLSRGTECAREWE